MNAFSSRIWSHRIAGCLIGLGWLLAGAPGSAQPIASGVAYLAGSQQADGSWESSEVRRVYATTEALRALRTVGQAPGSRGTAVGFLEAAPVEDSDDRARRIAGLAAEGRNVSSLLATLVADAHPGGGWGLTPGFVAEPLDTALALSALTSPRSAPRCS